MVAAVVVLRGASIAGGGGCRRGLLRWCVAHRASIAGGCAGACGVRSMRARGVSGRVRGDAALMRGIVKITSVPGGLCDAGGAGG